ncbi:hypothetical protein [Priestia sp. 40]|uniref:hypothetical protein n=1 Tax=Priestia sp. 40 TaxID=3394459 RepID=UPI003BF7E6B1
MGAEQIIPLLDTGGVNSRVKSFVKTFKRNGIRNEGIVKIDTMEVFSYEKV